MKLREQKRLLLFLRKLEVFFKQSVFPKEASTELLFHYTDSELREMIHWLYSASWSKNALGFMKRSSLIELITTSEGVLLWTIHKLEKQMTQKPKYSQEAIDDFFDRTNNQIHYLASKPVEQWDEYDTSNYHYLLVKTGTTKRVYAVFTSDVLSEDAHAVTTEPSYFFDTEAEAKAEIQKIVAQGDFTEEELVVHSLWLLS